MYAQLIVESGPDEGRRYVLRLGQRFVLGRGQGVSAPLKDDLVSRRHASVELDPSGKLHFRDLGSKNRSFFNGHPVDPHVVLELEHRDQVQLGKGTVLRVEIQDTADPAQAPAFLPAEEFEVLGELGAGASGKVLAARQRLLGRMVAIKLLHTDVGEERERLVREARVAQRVRSPYVVEVYDVRLFGTHLCLIMELINGPNLRDQMRSSRTVTVPQAVALAEDVGRALVAVHAEGVVHRDIKPGNVLVHPEGYALLADFGLAKDHATKAQLTASNVGMGSLAYVSPEQARGANAVDARADLYSLGATLYHLIAQRAPVTGNSLPKLLTDIVEGTPPRLDQVEPECPREVAAGVHQLLAKDPDARPQDAEAVVTLLESLRAKHFPKFVACVPGRRNQPQPDQTHGTRDQRLDLRPRAD